MPELASSRAAGPPRLDAAPTPLPVGRFRLVPSGLLQWSSFVESDGWRRWLDGEEGGARGGDGSPLVGLRLGRLWRREYVRRGAPGR